MRLFGFLFLLFVFFSCGGEKPKRLKITEDEIDEYVKEVIDPTNIYDITIGMRFSKDVGEEFESYEPTAYEQNDTIVLYAEQEELLDRQINRSIYFKEGVPVFIEEYEIIFEDVEKPFRERKIYADGVEVIKAYERSAVYETDLEEREFKEITVSLEDYDLKRAEDAVNQQGDYEMSFDEFLILPQSQYLVLSNKESGYNVALLILEEDEFINKLFYDQKKYKGSPVIVSHRFMTLNNVNQMVYAGGELKK